MPKPTKIRAAVAGVGVTSGLPSREDAGGCDDVFETGVDGQDQSQPDGDVQCPIEPGWQWRADRVGRMQMAQGEKTGDDGGALKDHFQFAGHLSREVAALLLNEATDGGDEHFATDNHYSHPRRDAARGPFG